MNALSLSAPGKLMIAGEYSVLFGGQALVTAIDKRAVAHFSPSSHMEYWARMAQNRWQRVDQEPLCCSIMNAGRSYGLEPARGVYRLDTSDFFENGLKLGLGSSAAICVALAKVLVAQRQSADLNLVHLIARKAHLDFSFGRGSGADVAASFKARAIAFQNTPSGPLVSDADLPSLCSDLFVVATNSAQDTRIFVKKAMSFAENNPDFIANFVKKSDSVVEAILKKPLLSDAINSFTALALLLEEFALKSDIDIMSKEHQALYKLARSLGGSAKPSGAGGGDISVALVPKAKRRSFETGVSALGLKIMLLRCC